MPTSWRWICGLLSSVTCTAFVQAAEDPTKFADEQFRPFLKKYCSECHFGEEPDGELRLDEARSPDELTEAREVFVRAVRMIRSGQMPPQDSPQPKPELAAKMADWLDRTVNHIDCSNAVDPGRETIRRLNRFEYSNTIRDLLGVDFDTTSMLPADDVGYGFDNIGDVLSVSPLLLEKYVAAARLVSRRAIYASPLDAVATTWITGVAMRTGGRDHPLPDVKGRRLYSNVDISSEYDAPADGKYEIRVKAYGEQAGKEPVRMTLRVDGKHAGKFDVKATRDRFGWYSKSVDLTRGEHKLVTAFINDYYDRDASDPSRRDRNLIVLGIEIRGPLGVTAGYPDSHRRIMTATPNDKADWNTAARRVLAPLATRAFRRQVTDRELDRLVKLTGVARTRKESFAAGIQLALQAILVSPQFLFRIELDPKPDDADAIRRLSEYELATRLSYFLWSSMPDDTLLEHARRGTLRKNLAAEVRRMLKDERSEAFVNSFASQWLGLRSLPEMQPDARMFSTYTPDLRAAMHRETILFFGAIKDEDRSILDLVDADFTFANAELARHYGIEGIFTRDFRRVELPKDSPRGGVLTQASVLTITSNPMRTSPVKRGKWVMTNILGTPPLPPPPDVPELDEDPKISESASMRERLEEHRRNPRCSVCHVQMDPLGLVFENYDPIGRWRDRDGRHKIDASGELAGGKKFDGPQQFKKILTGAKRDEFVRCLTEKMLTYALGRGVEPFDRCAVDTIMNHVEENDYRFSSLVYEIVSSDPFQKRRGTRLETKP
ncbi:MAG: DUF1592 domain-containing protein [Pirellulales bacterium]|nr:DUF1592 domain-containing protein [Pirellulales bacterium]